MHPVRCVTLYTLKHIPLTTTPSLTPYSWPTLYVYPKGASLRIHIDTTSKWQYWTQQHVGSKRVRIVTMSDWSKVCENESQPAIPNAKSQIQNPKCQIQNPKSQCQNPKSQIQNPKSKIQNPKSQSKLNPSPLRST